MLGYIRKRQDFRTVLINALSYDVTLHSIFGAASTVTCTYNGDVAQGDFVLCDGFCGVVKQLEISGSTMTLTCTDIDSLFDRPLYFSPDTDTTSLTVESFIHAAIILNYRQCDNMYARPYIETVQAASATPFFLPALSDKNMYTLSEYIRAARLRGVNLKYDLTGEHLTVSFGITPIDAYKLDFASANTVTSETYGGYSTAKVTNYVDGIASNYYLLSDGTVTQDANDTRRVYGAWEVLTDSTEEAILQKFAVTYGHEIVFSSTKQLPFLAPLQLKMPSGLIVDSFVSAVRKKSNDSRFYYTAGELRTTLTAKLRR